MNPVDSSINCKTAVRGFFAGGSLCAQKVGFFYSFAKVTYKSIDLTALLRGSMFVPVQAVSTALKGVSEFIEGSRFFGSLNELACPDSNGTYLLKNKYLVWQKIAERVAFAGHTALKMVNALWQWGFVNLARIAKYAIGHLTIFKLVTDGLFAVTSFFCVWASGRQIVALNKETKEIDCRINAIVTRQYALMTAIDENEIPNLEKRKASIKVQCASNYMKIITYTTKVILIPLALVFTALNLATFACNLSLLTLGVIGDSVGFARSFYEEYNKK